MGFFSWKTQDTDESIANNYSNRDTFRVQMIDNTGNGYTEDTYEGYVYGTVSITLDEGGEYTPYNQLTQEQVIGWVKDSLGEEQVTELEANVATQIQNQKTPPVVTPPLPWNAI
jgi:hypothetical protein